MGCAECHDHKFDPFTARDFYRLAAFFADVKQWGVYADYGYTPNPDLQGLHQRPPVPARDRGGEPLPRAAAGAARAADPRGLATPPRPRPTIATAAFDAWSRSAATSSSAPAAGPSPDVPSRRADAAGRRPRRQAGRGPERPPRRRRRSSPQDDGSLLIAGQGQVEGTSSASGSSPRRAGWPRSASKCCRTTTHRGKITRDGAASDADPALGDGAGGADRQGDAAGLRPCRRRPQGPALRRTARELIGVHDGWKTSSQHATVAADRRSGCSRRPVRLAEGDEVVVTVKSDNVGCIRLSVSPFGAEDPRETELGPALIAALRGRARGAHAPSRPDAARPPTCSAPAGTPRRWPGTRRSRASVLECRDGRALHDGHAGDGAAARRASCRGATGRTRAARSSRPASPSSSRSRATPTGRRLTRLDLARWLTSPENPLTARVFVNRLWKQFFGTGLSARARRRRRPGRVAHRTPSCSTGWPSSSATSGWDVKHMVKLMVMSATYRQDSRLRPELREIDPNNRLLASQSPAAARGRVRPRQRPGDRRAAQPRRRRPERPALPARRLLREPPVPRPRLRRRPRRPPVPPRASTRHWQRTFLHPMLANFDAPSREECTAVRTVANTPQQALTLLNDPTFVEAARVLAGTLLRRRAGSDDEARLDAPLPSGPWPGPRGRRSGRRSLAFLAAHAARRTASSPDEARKLLHVGLAPRPAGADAGRARGLDRASAASS